MVKAVFFDLGDTLINEETGGLLPYAREVLRRLRSEGYRLALICNATTATGKEVREILRNARIEEFFDAVMVSTDVGYRKPDEGIFRIALERLGLQAEQVAMVGNRVSSDILGGNRVGMTTVLVKWNARYPEEVTGELERPNYTIGSLRELLPIILGEDPRR